MDRPDKPGDDEGEQGRVRLTTPPRVGQSPSMLLWSGLAFLLLGIACFAVDRRATHLFHAAISQRGHVRIYRTTDFAKGGHWLAISIAVYLGARLLELAIGAGPLLQRIAEAALAFLASLAAGSLILHTLKIVLGRRRPRDELEHGLFGFRPFGFDLQYDSFPSGHALTIFCVAVILSGALPAFAPLWLAIAVYLSATRALLNAHFLSDVFIGAAVGLLAARETVLYLFPALWQSWF
jgi:membrane-associated phospholipid phosphatase